MKIWCLQKHQSWYNPEFGIDVQSYVVCNSLQKCRVSKWIQKEYKWIAKWGMEENDPLGNINFSSFQFVALL